MLQLNRWRTVALIAGALFVGSIVGPPLVQAATAGLVTIEGAGSSHRAKVSGNGELSVNPHLNQTKAGQVLATEAGAGNAVVLFRFPSCAANGIYRIPAGKALIITSVNYYTHATVSTGAEMELFAGPVATPCTSLIAAGLSTDVDFSQSQSFQPGIPVPAGDALGAFAISNSGSLEIYGYLVPAGAVPAHVLGQPVLSSHPGRSVTVR